MEKELYPCLWFNQQAREAADFYCSVFPDSEILSDNGMVVEFRLRGKKFIGLNGGPEFQFNESVSFVIECDDQQEIDHFWEKLVENGGQHSRCGWLKDRFGVSWQVVPSILPQLMSDPDKRQAVTAAFMKMQKFDIAVLKAAAEGS